MPKEDWVGSPASVTLTRALVFPDPASAIVAWKPLGIWSATLIECARMYSWKFAVGGIAWYVIKGVLFNAWTNPREASVRSTSCRASETQGDPEEVKIAPNSGTRMTG